MSLILTKRDRRAKVINCADLVTYLPIQPQQQCLLQTFDSHCQVPHKIREFNCPSGPFSTKRTSLFAFHFFFSCAFPAKESCWAIFCYKSEISPWPELKPAPHQALLWPGALPMALTLQTGACAVPLAWCMTCIVFHILLSVRATT